MVHGLKMNGKTPITPETLQVHTCSNLMISEVINVELIVKVCGAQDMKTGMTNSSMMLASVLESHGVHSRPLFCGSGVIQAYTCARYGLVLPMKVSLLLN